MSGKSFIPVKTCVVCTNMTVAKPLKLELVHQSTVNYKSEDRQMLNILDLKINDTFVCKNPAKFWSGLGAMLLGVGLGIIVGALIVIAVVGTGGAALVALPGIVALGAAVAAGGAISAGIGQVLAHDCDATLSGKWLQFHSMVNIDRKNALLQTSTLPCSKGGIISIVPDPVLAQKYAGIYTENNKKEIDRHTNSQFLEGLVTGITFLGSPIAAVVGLGLGSFFYTKGEHESQENQSKMLNGEAVDPRTMGGESVSTLKQEAVNQPVGIGIATGEELKELKEARNTPVAQSQARQAVHLENQAAQQEARAARLAANGAEEQAAVVARRAANSRLAADIARRSYPKFNMTKFLTGIGVGIAGAVVNFGIEYYANKAEDGYFKNVFDTLKDVRTGNISSVTGINIVATNN